ncbi:hypothetical protein CC86DRAFT_178170 [Ophiobolus disseminans]|uniref:Zn(2)-C6 fungal-type domain-containing protein n=1 Tax=Ophiobolus disseminans TaxID=1469910 RepID=A0A6A7A9Z7_9PLEO|nr:hypothetical protein CC86DRAFT_178170 [Ophiobolus disseminans]
MASAPIRPGMPNVDFHGGRVLLPRQERPRHAPISGRKRAKKACTSCRLRKTKCTADTPRCADCETHNLECVYEDNKKDRMGELTSQRQHLIDLVHDLRSSASLPDRQKIEDALDKVSNPPTLPHSSVTVKADEVYPNLPPPLSRHSHSDQSSSGSSTALPAAPIDTDVNIIDFWATTYDSNAAFVQADNGAQWTPNLHTQYAEASSSTFNPEDASFNYVPNAHHYAPAEQMEINRFVGAYDAPPLYVAQPLISTYRTTVQDWISIVPTVFFDREVDSYYNAPTPVNNTWLTILHLVCAIGTRYECLAGRGAEKQRDDVQHFSRAIQLLGVTESAIVTASPDVALVQCHGLLSLYYLTVHQVDRAWLTLGVALRYAISLNLHLKPPTSTPWPSRTETHARTWWALRTLESFLCSITSRPSSFPLNDCNVPLPSSPLSPTTLQVYVKITITTQWALSSLYTIKAATLPFRDIQARVARLKSELETLLPQIEDHQRSMLQFAWFDAMILITRPCLAATSHHDTTTRDLASHCVKAAGGLTRLLPDTPDARIWTNGPWWCLAHYIVRALNVLRACQAPEADKLVRWLQWMAPGDAVASLALKSEGAFGADLYRGWDEAADGEAQYLADFHDLDDLMDSDGVISAMVSQERPQMLPMPPVYGGPYG